MSPPLDGSGSDTEVIDLRAAIDQPTAAEAATPASARIPIPTWWDRNRVRVLVALALAGVVAVWALGAAVQVASARSDARTARETLLQGRDLLVAGDLAEAIDRFESAARRMDGVSRTATGGVTLPARIVPTYRRSLAGVAGLADASAMTARAATDVTRTVAALPGGLAALTPQDGRIPIDTLAALAPVLADAARDVTDAAETTRAVPSTGVLDEVADGREELLSVIGPAAESLTLGAGVMEVLPAIFGADGPRRYVVLASNPTENRGTGGFYGAYSVLEVDDGGLDFGPVRETLDLPRLEPGEITWPDPSLARRYDVYGGTRSFRNINMTPDFPAAAEAIRRYFAAGTGTLIDGVIAVDPFAFEALLGLAGPVELPELGELDADNVVEFVSRSAYHQIDDPTLRKTLIGHVATAALQGFLRGGADADPAEMIDVLRTLADRDALQLYSVRPDEQALLRASGLAGEFSDEGGDLLAVILNSGSGSKVDYFLQRSVRYDVDLGRDGQVTGTVTIGLDNTAPTEGEPAYIIGLPPPDAEFGSTGVVPVGTNRSMVSTYCSPGCRLFEVPDTGIDGLPTRIDSELGYGVTSTWLDIPAGQSRQLIVSHTAPGAWTTFGGDRVYDLHYEHQTSLTPIEVVVSVGVPDGFVVAEAPEGATVADGRVEWRRDAIADHDFRVRFTPA